MPDVAPVAKPPVVIVACDVLLLLHVPPLVASLSCTPAPLQILIAVAGIIAVGDPFTVIVVVVAQEPMA